MFGNIQNITNIIINVLKHNEYSFIFESLLKIDIFYTIQVVNIWITWCTLQLYAPPPPHPRPSQKNKYSEQICYNFLKKVFLRFRDNF